MFTEKRLSGWKALAVSAMVGVAMVAAGPAFAKADLDKLTIGGDAKVKYEFRTGATFGTTTSDLSAAAQRIRINVGYDLTPDVAFFAQLQDSRKYGSENCTFAGAVTAGGCVGDPAAAGVVAGIGKANQAGTGVDLHQGYIQVKNILHPGLSLKIGRQEIAFGDHRLFGSDSWSLVGNAFDGVRLTHAAPRADVDLFWARTSDNNSESVGSGTGTGPTSGVSFPGAGRRAGEDQDIYGAYVTLKPAEKWTVEPYFFWLADNRAASQTTSVITNPQAADQKRGTLGGRINGKAAGLDFTTEVAYQFGSINAASSGSAVNQRERINAHAEAVKIGYTFEPVPMKPRLGFEFNYASGDANNNSAGTNPHGGNFNTFENLFPTNHGKMGYMDLVAWKNMVGYSGTFDVKPSEKSKIEVKYSVFRLANKLDNWYRGNQTIYATSCGTGIVAGCLEKRNEAASLGQELDVHYWLTLKEKFKLEFGYGHFFSGEYLDKSRPAGGTRAAEARSTATFNQNGDQNWGYVLAKVEF